VGCAPAVGSAHAPEVGFTHAPRDESSCAPAAGAARAPVAEGRTHPWFDEEEEEEGHVCTGVICRVSRLALGKEVICRVPGIRHSAKKLHQKKK
jgi:hypothetical protein